MKKKIEIDGKFYRQRRGVLVEIPAQFLGRITTSKTIHDRKIAAKVKRMKRRVTHKFKKDLPVTENDYAFSQCVD